MQLDLFGLHNLGSFAKVAEKFKLSSHSLKFNDHIPFLQKLAVFTSTDPRYIETVTSVASKAGVALRKELRQINRYSASPGCAFGDEPFELWVEREMSRIERNKNLPKIGEFACLLRDFGINDVSLWRVIESAVVENKFADSASEIVNCIDAFSHFPLVVSPPQANLQTPDSLPHSKAERQLRSSLSIVSSCGRTHLQLTKVYATLRPHLESVLDYQNFHNLVRILKGAFVCPEAHSHLISRIAARISETLPDCLNPTDAFSAFKLLDEMNVLDEELSNKFERFLITGKPRNWLLSKFFSRPRIQSPQELIVLAYYVAKKNAQRPAMAETRNFLIRGICKYASKLTNSQLFIALEAVRLLASSDDELGEIHQAVFSRLSSAQIALFAQPGSPQALPEPLENSTRGSQSLKSLK